MNFRNLTFFFACLAAVSCTCAKKEGAAPPPTAAPGAAAVATSTGTPEDVVKSFVSLSAGAQSLADRERLQRLCVGEMRRAFERMTEETFRLTYLNSNIKMKELKVVEAKIEAESAKIRYVVSVENTQGADTTQETNMREVDLTKSQGAWYIETIRLKDTDKVAFTNGMMF